MTRMDVTLAEMRGLVRDPNVVVLDVLSPEAYAVAHIPGAVNMPVGRLHHCVAAELPDLNRAIVVYCGGPT